MGPSKRKEEKEIKTNIKERKIKKRAKFLGQLEDLTKQLKKDIDRRQGAHSTHSLVEIISLSGLGTFSYGVAHFCGEVLALGFILGYAIILG